MPQDRVLLHAEASFRVEEVRSHAVRDPGWSPVYATVSARTVFPMGATALDVRDPQGSWLADGLTAMRFAAARPYQLRPCAPSARRSLVLSATAADDGMPEPSYWRLRPRALYCLHAASRALRNGDAQDVAAFFAAIAACAEPVRPQGAVARARRLLNTDARGCLGASQHEIAEAVASSAFHLGRSFRRQTGLSLHQYRQHLRLAAALERLAEGERDLAGIAHELGYCSQSHLGAVFRQEVGVTLGEARRALNPRA